MSGFPISITWSAGSPPVDVFNQLAQAATKLDSALAASGANFDKFGQAVQQLESPLSGVGQSMGTLEGSMSGLEGSLGGAAGSMGEFAGSTEQLNGSISETGGFVTEASGSMGELSTSTTETGASMTELSGTTGEFNGAITETGGFVTETGASMTEMGTAATEGGTAMTELTTATADTNTALTESVDALGNVVPGLEDTGKGAEDSAAGFEALKPPLEDTNTALDASSGLLEGVSPLLADTGTNAETAGTATGDFSGALGGLNTELGPVNGGLTESNTLVSNLGDEAVTTSDSTKGLGDNMNTLVFGLTAAVSAGINLVNSFLSIRDAGFRVEASNIRAEKSAIAVDKAMLGLSKAIQKLATDSEAPIQGMTRLQTAFANFQKLIVAGVTSGPQYAAALNELKLAADGLEGSTVKDNNAIAAFQIQLDGTVPKISKMNLDSRKLNKAMEDQAKAFIETGLNVAAFAGGLGATIQSLTSAGAAATALKGGLATLGTTISTSVLPVLGAIAVPIGIAIAAITAFVAATLAIRANIKIFDDLGQKIGEVFPEMKGFLEDARQGFINMSDGINTAIGHLLAGIDSMSGGTTNLAKQWGDWTNTLPKGNGQISASAVAIRQLGLSSEKAGEQTNVGAGKWKILDGNLVRLNGSLLAVAGTFDVARDGTATYWKEADTATASTKTVTTAMDAMGPSVGAVGVVLKEQSANYSELTNAQKLSVAAQNTVVQGLSDEKLARFNAITEAEKYLVAHGTTAKAVGLSGDVLIGYVNSLKNEGPAYSASVQEATEYLATKHKEIDLRGKSEEWIIKTAAAMEEEDKALGKVTETTAKHIEELTKLKQGYSDTAAEIAFYADATQMAGRIELEYNLGLQDSVTKLNDKTFALARSQGELEGNNKLIEEGKLQEIAYAEGVVAAGNALNDKILALEKAKGAYAETNRLMKEGNLVAIEFATGMQETTTAVQQSTLEVINLAGELAGYEKGATKAQQANAEMAKGFLEQEKALVNLLFEYANASGAIESLRMELADADAAVLRFNKGVADGRKSALEFMVGMEEAKGEAAGFRSEVLKAANEIPGAMADMSQKSTEELQQLIEVANMVPGAFKELVNELDAMGQEIINTLADAAKEGGDKFMDEIDAMEKELGSKFSKPMIQELRLQAEVKNAEDDIKLAMGNFAAMLRDKPLAVALETQAAQDAMRLLQEEVNEAAALSPKFKPLQTALNNLAAWKPSDGLATLPVKLTEVLQAAQGMEGGMQGVIKEFDGMFSAAAQTQGGLDALSAAFTGMGLTFNQQTGVITDATGTIVGDLQTMYEKGSGSIQQTVTSMDTLGPAGTKARTTLAFELVALEFLLNRFAQEAKQSAIEISTAFSNMAANTGISMNKIASGFIIMLTAQTRLASDSQRMASTVSGSFSNLATNAIASMNRMASGIIVIIASFTRITSESQRMNSAVSSAMSQMASRTQSFASSFSSAMSKVSSSATSATSKVKALQSAINALKSKTIVITTVIRTVRQTVYAAQGGAFIQSNPGKVGPLSVSEFSQKELVTVTPLQGPGRQPIKGLGNMLNDETKKKARRGMDDEREQSSSRKSKREVVMMRETPIVVQIDGREITRVVNKRMFEESDSLT